MKALLTWFTICVFAASAVAQTATAFSAERLKKAITQIYDSDKALRDTRPDDRTIMERFVMELTARN